MTGDVVFNPPPRTCPGCRTYLDKAYPQCPACKEPLVPSLSKQRADRAVEDGLGLPPIPPPVPLCVAVWTGAALALWAAGFALVTVP